MNAPTRFAEVTGAAGSKPTRVLKIEKPTGGQAVTAEASYDGTVKIDFSAIANEKITLVHIGERLVILFDNQSTVTIIPFFDSMGVPLANITIESNGKEFSGADFASTFPITTDQSVLPAAGDGTGTPASGANFSNASVDPLLGPDPLPLLPPEVLPDIQFTRIEGPIDNANAVPAAGPNDPVSIDEDDIDSPFSLGNGDDALGDDDPISVSGVLKFTVGTAPTTVGFASMDGDTVEGEDGKGITGPLTSQGHDLVYVWDAGSNTLKAVWSDDPDHVVFQIEVNPTTGAYTLSLFDQLDHPYTDDPSTSADDATVTGFEDNLIVDLVYTITDGNGDVATGTLAVDFDDDMPRVTGEVESRTVDEDDIKTPWSLGTSPNDGEGDGSITENSTGAAFVSGTLSGLVDIGADETPEQEDDGEGEGDNPSGGPQAIIGSGKIFGFSADVITQMESLGLHSKQSVQPATENGIPLEYATSVDGDWVVLSAREPDEDGVLPDTGNPVFELRINQITGEYEFRLFDELIHVLPPGFPNGSDENFTLRTTGVDAIDFGSIITVTDYDGDGITLDGKFLIQIRDDVPEADIDGNHLGVVQHDETPGVQGPSFSDLADSDTNSAAVKALFATLETSGNVGNDPDVLGDANGLVNGDGPIGYARSVLPAVFSVFGTEVGADSPAATQTFTLQIVNGPDSGLTLTDGSHINLVQEGDLIVGRVVDQLGSVNYIGQAAFAIHIDGSGFLNLAQYLSLQHPIFPNSHDESISLAGKIEAVLTVTDSDGDADSDSVQIGSQIRFDDDGPTVDVDDQVSETERAQLRLALDESVQPDGGDSDTYDRYNSPETESGGGPSNGGSDDVDPGAADLNYNQLPVVDISANLVADEAIGSRTTNVTGGLNALFNVSVNFGADGPLPGQGNNPTDGLKFNLTGSGETNLVVTALDNTLLDGLSETARTVWLVKVDDNTIEGRIPGPNGVLGTGGDDFVAFRITITPDSQIKLDQFLAIDHDLSESPDAAEAPENPSLFDESIELRMVGSNNTLQLVRTVTATDGDNDQDTDSDSVTLAGTGSSFFTFDDDGPTVTAESTCKPTPPQPGDDANFVLVLDSSGSIDSGQLALIKANAIDFINDLAASGAQNVRVHIVDFDSNSRVAGTFDLIVGGEVQDDGSDAKGDQLQAALNAINALVGGGNTNYEAALAQANEWIAGGTVAVTDAHSFDADTDGGENNAYVLTDANGVRIAVVSAWEPFATNTLDDVDNDADGFGVNDNDELDETDEMLRFDFGAFNDFDGAGDFGLADEAAGFRGSEISAATFSLRDFDGGSNSVNYKVFYTDGTNSGLVNFPFAGATSLNNTISAPAGKLIAYIEFTVPAGEGGRVDLESVVIGTNPILNADVNRVVFFSDGEPNHALDGDGNVVATSDAQDAIDEAQNEIDAIETDGPGPDQAFIIEAFGANVQSASLSINGATQFDASVGGGGTDDAYVLSAGGVEVAIVSGWSNNGGTLVDTEGSNSTGWGVQGGGEDDDLDATPERLRFDFGAFNDYDGAGEYGLQGAATGFNGPAITSATYAFRNFEGGDPQTVNYTIHFTDLSTESSSHIFNGVNSGNVALAGTGGNLGKQIAYIEFSVPAGEAGQVDLQSVVLAQAPGLDILDQVDSNDAENITTNGGLGDALEDLLEGMAGAPGSACPPIVIHDETALVQTGTGGTNANNQNDGTGASLPPTVLALFNAIGAARGEDPDVDDATEEDNQAIGFARSGAGVSGLTYTVDWGTDGPHANNAIQVSYDLTVQDGTLSGVQTTDGQDVLLYNGTGTLEGLILGRVGGPEGEVAFALTSDPSTGEIFVAQYLSLEHPLQGDGSNGTFDETITLAEGTVFATVTVQDGDNDKATSNPVDIGKRIGFQDDGPTALCDTATVLEGGQKSTNLVLILDVSGSMAGDKLALAKDALINLLSTTPGLNEFLIVTFSDNAAVLGGGWYTAAELATAITDINALTAGGTTDYDDALSLAMSTYTGTPPSAADQTVAFFLSDGAPNPASEGIDAGEQTAWEQFLTNNGFLKSVAVGIETGALDADLAPIGFPNVPGNVIQIDSADDLFVTLAGQLPGVAAGNVLDNDDMGSDGLGHITSITVDGVTYTYLPGTNEIDPSAGANIPGSTLEVTTAKGGQFTFHFADDGGFNAGDWVYQAPAGGIDPPSEMEIFTYTVVDGDGDGVSAHLKITVEDNPAPVASSATAQVDDEGITPNGIIGNGNSSGDVDLPDPENVFNGSLNPNFGGDTPAAVDPISFAPMVGAGNVNGEAVTYAWDGTTNTLSATSVRGLLFTVQVDNGVDNGVGNFTFTLIKPLLHNAGGAENDITLPLTYRTTDDDGQFALNTLTVTIDDDTPVANLIASDNPTIVLDETDSAADGDVDGDDGIAGGILSQRTILGVSLFVDASQSGADTPATKAYSLVLNPGPTGLTDTLSGDAIVLTQPVAGGTIEGHAGNGAGPLVFTIAINASGDVTVTQLRAIVHNDFPTDHDESDDPESLPAGLVQLAVTITDADQDSNSDSIELGSLIKFEDDGPDAEIQTNFSGSPFIIVDESIGQNAGETGEPGNLGSRTVLAATLFADSSTFGSDGFLDLDDNNVQDAAAKVFSLELSAPNVNSGLVDVVTNSAVVLVSVGPGLVEGHAGSAAGPLVFSVSVNGAGDVTVTQFRAIKHDDVNDHDESNDPVDDPAVNETPDPIQQSIANGALSLKVTVVDGDRDSDSDSIDLGSLIRFEDDGPDVNIVDTPNSVNEGQTINGTYTLAPGSDGVTSIDVTVGAVTKTLSLAAPGNTVVFGAGDGLTTGTLTVDADGDWHFTANAVNANTSVTFSVKAADRDGDFDTDSQTIQVLNVNSPLTISGSVTGLVEEEHGLPGGIEDVTDAGGLDTDEGGVNTVTNVAGGSFGSLIVGGTDGPLSFQIATFGGNPSVNTVANGPLTSGGDPVLFHRVDADTLIGYTNSDGGTGAFGAGDTTVFTLQLTNTTTGAYSFTLQAPIDHPVNSVEDNVAVNLNGRVTVTDAGGPPADTNVPLNASITVIDDIPVATPDTASAEEQGTVNLMLIIDVSGSMGDNPGVPGFATRLDLAKAALADLLNSANVNEVLIVTFSTNAQSLGWFDNVQDAIDAINALDDGGSTNYDEALTDAMDAYNIDPPSTAAETVALFLSDGAPNEPGGDEGIDLGEQGTWETFLTTNGITSFAVGVGNGVNVTNLQPIAFPNGNPDNPVVVTNEGDLSETLTSLVSNAGGNVLTDGVIDDAFGADGGRILSIDVNGTIYTWNGASTVSTSGDPVPGGTVLGSNSFTTTTDNGGTFTFNFATGAWQYGAPTEVTAVMPDEVFNYTIRDNDGDTATATLTIDLIPVNDAPVISLNGPNTEYLDEFNAAAYNNSDGATNWAPAPWTESSDNNSAANGSIRVQGSELRFGEDGGNGATIQRTVNLAGATSATLTFDFEAVETENGENLVVSFAADGVTFVTLDTLDTSDADGLKTYNLTGPFTANAAIRFSHNAFSADDEWLAIDNVNVVGAFVPTYTEGGSAVKIMSAATVADADLPLNFNGGSITATLTAGVVVGDQFVLNGTATLVGTEVRVGGITVGNVTAGGFGTTSVTITLDPDATDAAVEAILQSLAYSSTSDNPTAAQRTATVTFNDGGNTGIGGPKSDAVTVNINVVPQNDAPTTVADTVITNVGASAAVAIPTAWLLANDTDLEGSALSVTSPTAVGGTGTVSGPAGGNVTFTDNATLDGSFTYQANDGSLSGLAATVTVDNNSSGTTTLVGGAGSQIIIGGGTNDTLRGGAGNDLLNGGNGTDQLDFSDGTAGINFTLTQSGADTVVNLSAAGLGTDTYRNMEGVIGTASADTLTGSSSADTIFGGGGADIITGGAGADRMTGGSEADTFIVNTGDSTVTLGGSGNAGTISGYDVITDFATATDKLSLQGTPAAAANTAGTNGNNSGLEIGSNAISSHAITNGIITFDDAGTFATALTLTSTAHVASVVDYLNGNDLGAAGTTVAFVANISGVAHTFIYEQLSTNAPGSANDYLLVDLENVTLTSGGTSLTSLISGGRVDPLILDLGASGLDFTGIQDGVSFDINADGHADRMAWTAGQDGILALDVNGNGLIDNGSEVFSPWFAGGEHAGSLAALATLDENHDGLIDANDVAYGSLEVWQDVDHDGVSDAGELTSLAALGITGINLGAMAINGTVDGQQLLAAGTFNYADGSTGAFAEVAFDAELGSRPSHSDSFQAPVNGGETYLIGANQPPMTIEGFAEGDSLDISALLEANYAAGDDVDDFVRLEQNGTDIKVQVDMNGPTGGANFVDVAVLAGYGTSNADIVRVTFENQQQQQLSA